MRTTVTIDDDLIRSAKEYAGMDETSAVIREALVSFVQREAGKRLVRLGGSDPDAELPPRSRPWSDAAE